MRNWNELSMAEKADVMKLAIEGGVYDLDAIRDGYNEYAKGGKIHIKPENRGKLTALKQRTGKTEAELYTLTLTVTGGQLTRDTANFTASFCDMLNTEFPKLRYTAYNAPGLKYVA